MTPRAENHPKVWHVLKEQPLTPSRWSSSLLLSARVSFVSTSGQRVQHHLCFRPSFCPAVMQRADPPSRSSVGLIYLGVPAFITWTYIGFDIFVRLVSTSACNLRVRVFTRAVVDVFTLRFSRSEILRHFCLAYRRYTPDFERGFIPG